MNTNTFKTNTLGHLEIGGMDTVELAHTYGTPLYVMDEEKIRTQCKLFKSVEHTISYDVIYASKAFLTLYMAKLIDQEGLSLDVVSGGELYTAYRAGFPMNRVYFHGNNKSKDELKMALEYGVGTIIIDNRNEFELLSSLLSATCKVSVLLRVNPGIEAHTHAYIQTTKNDSKFGVSIFDPETLLLIQDIYHHQSMNFEGLHSHIGSQIFEENSFLDHASAMMNFVKKIDDSLHISVNTLNLGGGFGSLYTSEDHPLDSADILKKLLNRLLALSIELDVKPPKCLIEPGRAIVAEAGVTLYTVGSTKKTMGTKNYVFVDGSMADHIRTALYQATYHAVLANRMKDPSNIRYSVAGKACESGDIIIHDVLLPVPHIGDTLAVFTTGAYHYSMSSNYNRLLKPAVVFVNQGKAQVVVKRETYEDLIRNDVML